MTGTHTHLNSCLHSLPLYVCIPYCCAKNNIVTSCILWNHILSRSPMSSVRTRTFEQNKLNGDNAIHTILPFTCTLGICYCKTTSPYKQSTLNPQYCVTTSTSLHLQTTRHVAWPLTPVHTWHLTNGVTTVTMSSWTTPVPSTLCDNMSHFNRTQTTFAFSIGDHYNVSFIS